MLPWQNYVESHNFFELAGDLADLDVSLRDVLLLDLDKKFDLICSSYLLNYARTADELDQMSRVIVNHLKPGGRFITINSNPDYRWVRFRLLLPFWRLGRQTMHPSVGSRR